MSIFGTLLKMILQSVLTVALLLATLCWLHCSGYMDKLCNKDEPVTQAATEAEGIQTAVPSTAELTNQPSTTMEALEISTGSIELPHEVNMSEVAGISGHKGDGQTSAIRVSDKLARARHLSESMEDHTVSPIEEIASGSPDQ